MTQQSVAPNAITYTVFDQRMRKEQGARTSFAGCEAMQHGVQCHKQMLDEKSNSSLNQKKEIDLRRHLTNIQYEINQVESMQPQSM